MQEEMGNANAKPTAWRKGNHVFSETRALTKRKQRKIHIAFTRNIRIVRENTYPREDILRKLITITLPEIDRQTRTIRTRNPHQPLFSKNSKYS